MPSSQRSYLRIFGTSVCVTLSVIAAFNAVMDPIGAYPSIDARRLQLYRASYLSSRAAKAELVARGGCEIVLLGSSRVQDGLPVNDPAYRSDHVYNLGLDVTSLLELSAVLDFTLRHNHVKQVLLGADFFLFSDVRTFGFDFDSSRFNPHLNLVEYHFRNLLGADATAQSWSMLRQARRNKTPPPAERGFIPKVIPRGLGQRDIFAARIRGFLTKRESYAGFHYSQDRLALFREIVRRCRDRGVQLIVFIPPVHALQLETIRVAKLWPTFEQWKIDLASIIAKEDSSVPLWDFSGYRGRLVEDVPASGDKVTRMKWYVDSSHFSPPLGELMLARIFATPASEGTEEFGFRLTSEDVRSHLNQIRLDRQSYAETHRDEIVWVAQLAEEAKGGAPKRGDF